MGLLRFVVAAGLAALAVSGAFAQFVQQGPAIIGGGWDGASAQGVSVAISADGNTAVVGGPDDLGSIGAIWTFVRKNGVWTQQPKLNSGGAAQKARQGHGVAISADGNTIVEGGPDDNGGIGAVWVFKRGNDGFWSQQGGKLVGTGGVVAGQGLNVAISADGNTAAVAGPYDSGQLGAVWVFTRKNGVWSQQGSKLVGSGAVGSAYQGWSLALSGDGNTLAFGGSYDSNNTGALWIFTRTNGVWIQQGDKLVGTSASYQGFGTALSADGNTVIASGMSGAYEFVRRNGVWSEQSRFYGSDATSQQVSSVGLSPDGNTAILGSTLDNHNAGAAWIFTRQGGGWSQLGSKLVGTGAPAQFQDQGRSVALSADGSTAIVGGPGHLTGTPGASWIYVRAALPDLYILDSGNHLIRQYDSQGKPVSFGSRYAAALQPSALAVDPDGNTWLTDASLNQVVKQDGNGDVVLRFGVAGSGAGQLCFPNGVAVDVQLNVWVADTGNSRVQEFDRNGNYLLQFGGLGGGDGRFYAPVGIAVDPSGNVWVADTGNNRVQKFDSSGHFLLKFGSFGSGPGQFAGPFSIAFDAVGNAWVADPYNQRIEEFSSNGVYLRAFGGNFSFASPYGVAVDSLGGIWSVDYNLSQITEFDTTGAMLFQFGSTGANLGGQLYHPTYIVAK